MCMTLILMFTCWQVKTNNHVLVVDAVYVNHLLNVTST